MPAMKIATCANGRRLTTRPLAGDDFQLVCILNGAFRIVTLLCNIPVWVLIFSVRLSGTELMPGGQPFWCRSDQVDLWTLYVIPAADAAQHQQVGSSFGDEDALDDETKHQLRSMIIPFSLYLSVSLLYNILDIILSLAIWNAAAIGTPVEPRGRERSLASMVWIKIIVLNLLLCTVLGSGIYLTYSGRLYNYGCSSNHKQAVEHYETSIWYGLFSASMVVYAVELLMWPCVIVNQVGHFIAVQGRQTSLFRRLGRLGDEEGCCAQCIFCCIQCIRWLSCNRMGGGSIEAKHDLADAAIAFMNFMNAEVNFGIVLSDIYVAFKLLDRKHREVRYKLSKQARMDKKQTRKCEMGESGDESNNNGVDDDTSSPIDNVNFSVNYADVLNRRMLSEDDATDMYLLRKGARYSQYARGVYTDYPRALLQAGLLDGGWDGLYSPWKLGDKHSLLSTFRLTEFGFHSTALIYANFLNNVAATPYCILLDEIERTLVIVIRGSVTLEDLVTDLQFSAIELNRVGEIVGFDGRGKYCHRGMLTNSKWIYNDIHKQKIVSDVLRDGKNNPYRDYNLVITGHSLGGSCAAILTIMFKPMYPNVKCYAFCPPGCTLSMNLASECDDFITSFVVGNDIIPSRYEFLEILARVKVSKIAAFRDSRYPCRNKDLEVRNKRILHARNAIPDTEYYQKLVSFRENRENTFDRISPIETRLNIPGRVIHLIRFGDEANNRYLPYYKSRMFREIHFCLDSMKDHSIKNLSDVLPTVVSEYENTSTAASNDDDDDISVQSANSFGGDISEEPWFVTLSFPQGIAASLIPTLLALGAVCFSVIGNNLCTLFERRITNTPTNNMKGYDEIIAGVSYGLYFYGVQYFDEANEIDITQCKPYPSRVVNDGYVKAARAFSAVTLIIGFPIVLILCLTSCMKLKDRTLRVMSTLLMLVAICQVMIFVFLSSARCVDDPNPVDSSYSQSQFVWAKCAAYRGSKNVIIAGVLWTLCAFTLGFSSRLSLIEARLRFASMSLSSATTQNK
eukprot:scaffold5186_cov152-Skeletonema_menzelii.AAC.2